MMFGVAEDAKDDGSDMGQKVEGYFMGRFSNTSGQSYEEYKDAAYKVAERTAEKAKELKEKALDWLSSFQTT